MIKKKIITIVQDPAIQKCVAAATGQTYHVVALQQNDVLPELIAPHADSACLILEMHDKSIEIIAQCKKTFALFHVPILTVISNPDNIAAAVAAGTDDFITLPAAPTELKARIDLTVQRTERALARDPLTGLASTPTITRIITQQLRSPLAILYIDIDYFKAYNDVYGFDAGDTVIRFAATVLRAAVKQHGNATDFIGRLGGDDFAVVTTSDKADTLAQATCSTFDTGITQFYTPEAVFKKKITVPNRQGAMHDFPLASLSIGIVSNENRTLTSIGQIARIAAELKQYAKTKPGGAVGSNYVKDRRRQ